MDCVLRKWRPCPSAKRIRRDANGEKIVNIRLRPDQEERINAIVERSAILDTSKFVRIAVDWLLRSDIGEVIKKIVDEDYPSNPEKAR